MKRIFRGAASGCDGEAFPMSERERNEVDPSESRSKRQKKKEEGGEGAVRRIR